MIDSRFIIPALICCAIALTGCGGSGGGSDDGESHDGRDSAANSTVTTPDPGDTSENTEQERPTQPPATGDEAANDDEHDDDQDGNEAPPAAGNETPDVPPVVTAPGGTTGDGGGSDAGAGSGQESLPDTGDQSGSGNEDKNEVPGSGSDDTDDNGAPSDQNGSDDVVEPDDNSQSETDDTQNVAGPGFRLIPSEESHNGPISVTVGQVFARGTIAPDQNVVAYIDEQPIPTQVDKKATWADGSLRHAVVTVRVPESTAASNPLVEVRGVSSGGSDTGSPVTLNQLLGTSFDATVSLDVDGTEFQASARNLLSRAMQLDTCSAWGKECKRWLSGPLTSEWIVGGPASAGSDAHPHLNVYFHVRAYADASGQIARVRVDSVIENNWAYTAEPSNQHYNARITVGDDSLEVSNLTHYRQARWHRVMWWHDAPKAYAQLDTEYLQSTGAISNYADLDPSKSWLSKRPSEFPPMTNGNQTKTMSNAGAQAGIGPLPTWTSAYVVSGAPEAFQWMLANDDAVGSYRFHYRDRKTGRPLRITDHPYVTEAAISFAHSTQNEKYKVDLLPSCKEDCGSPYEFNIAHHPSIGYVPYLVTGDYYYLEEMQFTASYIELWANPVYRQQDKGRLRVAQSPIRGQAWSLRSISDAAFATPDDDPMKPYFENQIATILADYLEHYVDSATTNPLHFIRTQSERTQYPVNGQAHVGVSTWQIDFFTWAVGHVAEQGFDNAQRFLEWLAPFQIGMMTNALDNPETGYCWLVASAYKLQVRPSPNAPMYGTLDEAYKQTFGDLHGLECNSQEYVNRLGSRKGKTYQRGQMVGYAHSSTGFPANLQIGLAMAADSGLPNAKKAWHIFESRSIKPDYSSDSNFAVVPRF